MTAAMEELPLARLELCVEDSREVEHQITFLKRCAVAACDFQVSSLAFGCFFF